MSDLDDPNLPTIHKMLHEGACALISPHCAGPRSEASVMLTAGAGAPVGVGSRLKGSNFVKEFYDADEVLSDGTTAGKAYTVRTGRKAPAGSAVFLGLGQTLRENAKLSSLPAKVGTLGDALRAAGIVTGVTGNADKIAFGKEQPFDRSAAVLAMDSRGIVDFGSVSPHPGPLPKGGRELSDITPTLSSKEREFRVIYFGKSSVLDETKISISDYAYEVRRAEMLRELDSLLLRLTSQAKTSEQTLILVSFSPPAEGAWDQLTPIIVYGPMLPGLLNSPTTRTPGLIAASDFAPLALGLWNLPASDEMTGRCPQGLDSPRGPEWLAEMSARVTSKQRGLTPIAVFIVAWGALSFTPTALIVAFGLKPSRRILGLLRTGLVAGGTTFAALLLAVLAPAGAVWYAAGTVVGMALLTALCFGLAAALKHKVTVRAMPVVLVFAVTAMIIVADALTGCNLCKWSGPSSYQISAMRFYGIGNEYAGVLIPMAALAALFSPYRKWLVPVAGMVTILLLGLGNLGANYGGTAAAAVTFVLLWFAVARGGFRARHVALAFGIAIAAVAGLAATDWALTGAAGSHAARATGLANRLGIDYLATIAVRKLLFNLRITFSEEGLHYALAFVPFLALYFWRVQDKVRSAFKDDPHLTAGIKAVLVGAAAAFLLNDSGIVFAGIMIAITVLVLLYSLLEELRVES